MPRGSHKLPYRVRIFALPDQARQKKVKELSIAKKSLVGSLTRQDYLHIRFPLDRPHHAIVRQRTKGSRRAVIVRDNILQRSDDLRLIEEDLPVRHVGVLY